MRLVLACLASLTIGAACRDSEPTPDAKLHPDAAHDGPMDKAWNCAATFGNALTNAFGRLDGTVRAVVPPGYPSCPMPNGTHLVIQVDVGGDTYRMVTNVLSDQGPPQVYVRELDAPLAGEAWTEGWHPGTPLDYVTTLHVASTEFVSHDMTTTVGLITDQLEIGAKISVFATSSGGTNAASAHLVHKNLTNADGAIVIHPDGATPHYLLFRFDEQAF